jgi:hypothetical protein
MDHEWNVLSFGHGIFLQCELQPIVYQGHWTNTTPAGPVNLIADQHVTVGVLIKKPLSYTGTANEFYKCIEKYFECLELGFKVMYESTDVEHETLYQETFPGAVSAFDKHSRKYAALESGFLIAYTTTPSIAAQYHRLPLVLKFTLDVVQVQGKPFNQRFAMDQREMDVRLLIDLNRYRPQKIPQRCVISNIEVSHPVFIESFCRELGAGTHSIVSITVRNTHRTVGIKVHNLAFHLERSRSSIVCESPNTIPANYYTFALLNNDVSFKGNLSTSREVLNRQLLDGLQTVNSDCIIIQPNEEHTFLYSVGISSELPSKRFSNNISSSHNAIAPCTFITPMTLFWSVHAAGGDSSTFSSDNCAIGGSSVASSEQTGSEEATKAALQSILGSSLEGKNNKSRVREVSSSVVWCVNSPQAASSGSMGVFYKDSIASQGVSDAQRCVSLDITMQGHGEASVLENYLVSVCIVNTSDTPLYEASLQIPRCACCDIGRKDFEHRFGLCMLLLLLFVQIPPF